MTAPRKRAAKPPEPAPPAHALPEPGETERKAIVEAAKQQRRRPVRIRLKIEQLGPSNLSVGAAHGDDAGHVVRLRETFGSRSGAYADDALNALINIVGPEGKEPSERTVNAGLAVLGAIEPRDELEAAMALQIIAAHTASLEFLNRARRNMGEYRDTACAYVNAATKLSRTMAVQIEALARLRSGGKQTHEVRYVYVNGPVLGAGAQAVFGARGGGLRCANFDQPHGSGAPALTIAPGEPVWSENTARDAMPVAVGPREAPLPDARRRGGLGGAEGQGERPLSDGGLHTRADASASDGPGASQAGARDALNHGGQE
jgi:hypothetical protein